MFSRHSGSYATALCPSLPWPKIGAAGFSLTWPIVGNAGVLNSRSNYGGGTEVAIHAWLDRSKPPLKS